MHSKECYAARIATLMLLEELRVLGGSVLKDIWTFCGVVLLQLKVLTNGLILLAFTVFSFAGWLT